MKRYGLAALAPLPLHTPHPLHVEQVTQVYHVGERRPSPRRVFRLKSQSWIGKNLPEWAEEFSESLLPTGQQHADVKTKCTLIKKVRKKKFL